MSSPSRFRAHRLAALFALAVLILWAAGMLWALREAALPDEASGTVMAVFAPGASQEDILASVVKAGGRPVRVLWPRSVWIVNSDEINFVSRLKNMGAIAAYGELPMGPVLAGCFAYVDTRLPGGSALLPKP